MLTSEELTDALNCFKLKCGECRCYMPPSKCKMTGNEIIHTALTVMNQNKVLKENIQQHITWNEAHTKARAEQAA